MSGFRLSISVVAGVVATLLAMACLPAVAQAQANISVVSAGPDSSGNPYDLTVVADDSNSVTGPLTSMIAHVYDSNGNELPSSPYTMNYVSGTPDAQTWAIQAPIPQSDLRPGTYTVAVDMSDSTGENDPLVPAPQPFTVSYTTTTVTANPNPPTVTAGSQSVTFTGAVTGAAPGGNPVGIADAPVLLSISGGTPSQVAVTDSGGGYTATVNDISQTADYNFSVTGTSSYAAGNDDVTVDTEQSTTSITVTPSPMSVTEGSQTVNFAGSVTDQAPGSTTWPGLAGVPVELSINGIPSQSTTTAADGSFSFRVTGISSTADYNFSVAGTNLYTGVSQDVTVPVNQAESTITATADPAFVTYNSQDVNFSGTVTAVGASGTVPVSGAQVYVSVGGGPATPLPQPTDSNGDFSYSATGISQDTTYTFSINSTSLYSSATDPVTVPVDLGHTEMTATASPPDVNLATSTVTFSGTVTVTPAGGSAALGVGSGVPVYLSVNGAAPTQVTTTDDASGDFTDTISGITQAGDYNFSVNASDLYAGATEDVPIGLDQLATNMTVTPSRSSVTEGAQDVTFSGVVTGTVPGGSTSVGIWNAPVYLNGGSTPVAYTSQQGTFSYQATNISGAGSYNFSVAGSATTYSAATDDVPIGTDPAQTRIIGAKIAPAHLKYGQKATLTGTVQYLSGTTWTALGSTTVHLAEGKTSVGSASTGTGGTFSVTLPTTHGLSWRATVSPAVLIQQTSAIGSLSISVPMIVKSFSAKLGVLDGVTSSGCLQVTVPVRYGPESKIEIQYRSGTRGPWKLLGKLQLHNVDNASALCRDDNESYFSGVIRAKLPNAYYRAYFPASYSFQAAASGAIHSWRYATKITGYDVTPRSVKPGALFKITGRLWRHVKSWQPYRHADVSIIYNEKGTSFWATLGKKPVKTSSGGYFSMTAQASGSNYTVIIYAVYRGSTTDLAVQSAGLPESVKDSIAATGQAAGIAGGNLPVLEPFYRGLGRLTQEAVSVLDQQLTALASGPR